MKLRGFFACNMAISIDWLFHLQCLCFHLCFLVFLPCIFPAYFFGNVEDCILISVNKEFLLIGYLVIASLT